MTGKEITSLVLVGLAAAYDASPVDIIPDLPVIGWVDDFFITATTVLNAIQAFTEQNSAYVASIAKSLKWMLFILGVIVILLVALLGASIVAMLK